MRRNTFIQTAPFLSSITFTLLLGACSTLPGRSITPEKKAPVRISASGANSLLPHKTEIKISKLVLKKQENVFGAMFNPIGGYSAIYSDRKSKSSAPTVHSFCRFICIGGSCETTEGAGDTLAIENSSYVVTHTRMIGGSRITAFLAPIESKTQAGLLLLECALGAISSSSDLKYENITSNLPKEVSIDRVKHTQTPGAHLGISNKASVIEYATNPCFGDSGKPFNNAALFALTKDGVDSFYTDGTVVNYTISCQMKDRECRTLNDYLDSNGVTGCLK